MLEPYYDSYTAMIQMAGGVRRPVTLRSPDFRLDLDELRAAVTSRTRFVLLNSPHNPTGTVLTRAELQAVADLAIEHDLVVITDEVYEHLVYDGREHVPLATLPGMFERTLTLSSAGKSYSFTGWKVGWATGPAELVGAVLAAKQWLTFTSGSPLQPAVAFALDEEPDFPVALAADLQARRDLLCAGLADVGLDVRVPEGTYFATTDISALGWADGLRLLPRPPRAGRRRRDPHAGLLRLRRRSAAGPLGLLQAARRDRGGSAPAGRRRPLAASGGRPCRSPVCASRSRPCPWPSRSPSPGSPCGST